MAKAQDWFLELSSAQFELGLGSLYAIPGAKVEGPKLV